MNRIDVIKTKRKADRLSFGKVCFCIGILLGLIMIPSAYGCRNMPVQEKKEPAVIRAGEADGVPSSQPVLVGRFRDETNLEKDDAVEPDRSAEDKQEITFPREYSPTTGEPLTDTAADRPVLVVIGNAPEVRPQTSLLLADTIYEFPLEKKNPETRFLAVFFDALPDVCGPIVSARSYMIDLGAEWGSPLVINGYPDGPEYPELNTTDIVELSDVFWKDTEYFFRDKTVTDNSDWNWFVRLRTLAHDAFDDDPAVAVHKRFLFEEGVSYSFGRSVAKVGIPLFGSDFKRIEFVYNQETNRFDRYEKNSKGKLVASKTRTPNEDGSGLHTEPVSVQNLIIQYVPYSYLYGDYRTADLLGNGRCEYFINGKTFSGIWKRSSEKEPTQYLLNNQSEVALEPGNTWIVIHPLDQEVLITYRGSDN